VTGAQQRRPVVGHGTSFRPPHLGRAGEMGFHWGARELERLHHSVVIK
jgi:hypothetical protein